MTIYLNFKDETPRAALFSWWSGLEHRRGERAALRRCRSPEDVVFQPSYHTFLAILEDSEVSICRARVALVVGLCARVLATEPAPKGTGLGGQLGAPAAVGGPARVSELRFRRLLGAKDDRELYTQLRRILSLVKGHADLTDLAQTAYGWSDKTRWRLAHNYYSQAPRT